jgi:cyclic-di-GMP-binding protein
MADQNSFDVVSKVDMQEAKNAIDQALKEIHQRFDFKGTKTELTLKEKENELVIVSDDEYKLKSVVDILKAKLIKRSVSVKAFTFGVVEPALGGTVRQTAKIQNGLAIEKAKEIVKEIKEGKFKVQAQIQGDQLRVQSKSRDELQAVIAFLKGRDFGVDLQYINYR